MVAWVQFRSRRARSLSFRLHRPIQVDDPDVAVSTEISSIEGTIITASEAAATRDSPQPRDEATRSLRLEELDHDCGESTSDEVTTDRVLPFTESRTNNRKRGRVTQRHDRRVPSAELIKGGVVRLLSPGRSVRDFITENQSAGVGDDGTEIDELRLSMDRRKFHQEQHEHTAQVGKAETR